MISSEISSRMALDSTEARRDGFLEGFVRLPELSACERYEDGRGLSMGL